MLPSRESKQVSLGSVVLLVASVACGSADTKSPTPAAKAAPVAADKPTTRDAAPAKASPPEDTKVPDTKADDAPPTIPPPGDTLASLLPEPTPPLTLQHARELAGKRSWLAAASVYGALFRADPKDVRALAGRGFALASSGDPRAEPFARADFTQALTLSPSPATAAMVHFNFGTLEEKLGHLDAARTHFGEAVALHPSAASTQALARVSGTPAPARRVEPICEMSGVDDAQRATGALDIVTRVRKEQGSNAELPADDNAASTALCEGTCETAFVSTLGDEGSTIEAHVVVHERGGYWLVPKIVAGNGPDARCPDEIVDVSVDHLGPLVRARFSLLVNFWDDCDMDDPECLNGCFWSDRVDHVVMIDEAKGRYVVITARSPEIDEGAGGAWRSLEGTPVLPPDMVKTDGAKVIVKGCGLDREVTL